MDVCPEHAYMLERCLFRPGMNLDACAGVVSKLADATVDYGDLFWQHIESESWSLEAGLVKRAHYDLSHGIGLRAIVGDACALAVTEQITPLALRDALNSVVAALELRNPGLVSIVKQPVIDSYYPAINPLTDLPDEDKVRWLQALDAFARSKDNRVVHVEIRVACSCEIVLVINTLGELNSDIRPMVRLDVSVVAEEHGKKATGYGGFGGRYPLEDLRTKGRDLHCVTQAIQEACINLKAKPALAGGCPVVLAHGWPGVLLHEAIGHGLEADAHHKKTSVYTGKMGEMIASKHCTVYDQGSLPNARGSLNIDDEGTPTQATCLIDKGKLVGLMHSKQTALLMGEKPTGNGRRESYQCLPMPRMTNTFLAAGEDDPDDILSSLDEGIYAVNFSGGQVDITSGRFVFSASLAYWVKGGRIQHPLENVTLIGEGADVLKHISMVGRDWSLDAGIGVCGKQGQSVPVGVGQPTVRVEHMTIGGVDL